ncbi:MAG: hypothetical protein JO313_15940 [Verrucomicrobia bacterium]|nr:hypothetical protein [Verrucomicrobiota bacterium]
MLAARVLLGETPKKLWGIVLPETNSDSPSRGFGRRAALLISGLALGEQSGVFEFDLGGSEEASALALRASDAQHNLLSKMFSLPLSIMNNLMRGNGARIGYRARTVSTPPTRDQYKNLGRSCLRASPGVPPTS